MDKLRLNGIDVECILGDLPEERLQTQHVQVDVELELDLTEACESDRLEDTVDYAELAEEIREALQEAKCRLLEAAAGIAADICLDYPQVERAKVAVRKFAGIPGLGSAEAVVERTA